MGSVIIFTQIAPPVRMRNEHWQRKLSEDFALITRFREFSVETDPLTDDNSRAKSIATGETSTPQTSNHQALLARQPVRGSLVRRVGSLWAVVLLEVRAASSDNLSRHCRGAHGCCGPALESGTELRRLRIQR